MKFVMDDSGDFVGMSFDNRTDTTKNFQLSLRPHDNTFFLGLLKTALSRRSVNYSTTPACVQDERKSLLKPPPKLSRNEGTEKGRGKTGENRIFAGILRPVSFDFAL